MPVGTRIIVMCDKCNAAYNGSFNEPIEQVLDEGIKNGWAVLGKRVYCPDCKPTKAQ